MDTLQPVSDQSIALYTSADSVAIPIPETVFNDFPSVPIQRTYITVRDRRGRQEMFVLFYRNSKNLPRNPSLVTSGFKVRWNGDLLLVQIGRRKPFVNLRNWTAARTVIARQVIVLLWDGTRLTETRFLVAARPYVRAVFDSGYNPQIPSQMLFTCNRRYASSSCDCEETC